VSFGLVKIVEDGEGTEGITAKAVIVFKVLPFISAGIKARIKLGTLI
jgi:hypothetical protein